MKKHKVHDYNEAKFKKIKKLYPHLFRTNNIKKKHTHTQISLIIRSFKNKLKKLT